MTSKLSLTILCSVLIFSTSSFSQCSITPVTSISGSRCVGTELKINSNILPETVRWELNGNLVSNQTVTMNPNAVTVAGGNGAGSAMNQLDNPDRIYVDAAGVMYIPDLTNNRIQKWMPGATSGTTVAGGNGAGSAANQLSRPTSVFADLQGNVFVTDQNNKRVQKWAPGATSGITVAGMNNDLLYPTDIFIDKNDNMYVSDQYGHVVRKYASGSQTGVIVAGNGIMGATPTTLNAPTGIFVDLTGNLYVCDTDNYRVQKFAPGSLNGVTIAQGFTPLDVTVDCNNNVLISDYSGNRIVKYGPGSGAGITVAGIGGSGTGASQLSLPVGVFIVGNNNLFVADFGNHRIQRFSTGIDPRYTATQAGIYTITVDYACCPTFREVIEIYNQQQPSVTVSASSTSVCPGDVVTFTATNNNAIADPVFEWKLNGTTVGSNSPNYQNATLQNQDKLLCILSSTRACTSPANAGSNTVLMDVFTPVPLQLDDKVMICPGTNVLLEAPTIYNTYTWQDNTTQPSLLVDKEGAYSVTVTDACNNSYTETIVVAFHKIARNFLPGDTTICSYDLITLKPSVDFSSYEWSNLSTATSIVADRPGMYWLKAKDANNCEVRDEVLIQFKTCPPRDVYMPNAFTPNHDGKNDLFKPTVYGVIRNYKLSVYNRNGQIIFSSTSPQLGWDGTFKGQPLDTGTYVWVCTYEPQGQKAVVKKGTVIIVR